MLISGTDRVTLAAQQLGLHDEQIIINVQGDQPLISTQTISDIAAPFSKQSAVRKTWWLYVDGRYQYERAWNSWSSAC